MKNHHKLFSVAGMALLVGPLMLAQGCLATRDWVKEQMDPVSSRVTQSENRIKQADSQISALGGRVTGMEGQLGQIDGRVGQIDGKAEKALSGLANLRLERKLVVDFRDGVNFAFNNSTLPAAAKREIDAFLSDAQTDLAAPSGALIVVAGHTDNVGSAEYNYELGRRRAEGVARYLMTEKQIDPLSVVTVSYGKNNPTADNNSQEGRAKNRRVEIMVYRDGISSTPTTAAATPRTATERAQTVDETLSRR